jgi:hypothetical protein
VNPTRHVERLPLRTPYPAIVRTVAELVRTPELNSATDEFGGEMHPVLAIDATGVGAPDVDMFREEIERNNTAWLMPIVITGGHHVTRGGVAKHKLVSRAVKYLQQGQLK